MLNRPNGATISHVSYASPFRTCWAPHCLRAACAANQNSLGTLLTIQIGGINLPGTRHFTSIWDYICRSLVLFLSPQAHWAVHSKCHCLPITLLEKQLQTYAERQDRKRGDRRSEFIWSHPEYHSWPWECISAYAVNISLDYQVQHIKTDPQLSSALREDQRPTAPPLVSLLIQTLCSTIDPVLRGDWPVRGWARRFHHTLSWQSLSSRSWPRHWAWRRSWRSCRGTALSVRSLASRTHMGSHLHELRLPTAVPNKQQTNGVALKLISTYHGTDAEH